MTCLNFLSFWAEHRHSSWNRCGINGPPDALPISSVTLVNFIHSDNLSASTIVLPLELGKHHDCCSPAHYPFTTSTGPSQVYSWRFSWMCLSNTDNDTFEVIIDIIGIRWLGELRSLISYVSWWFQQLYRAYSCDRKTISTTTLLVTEHNRTSCCSVLSTCSSRDVIKIYIHIYICIYIYLYSSASKWFGQWAGWFMTSSAIIRSPARMRDDVAVCVNDDVTVCVTWRWESSSASLEVSQRACRLTSATECDLASSGWYNE